MKTIRLPLPAIVLTTAAFLLFAFPTTAQQQLKVKNGCAYKTAAEDATLYTLEPSDEARRIVGEICNAVGVSQNFDLRASSVDNALATTEGNRRIILYSTVFLNNFNKDARTRWAAYSVLAHEIGHHFNGHDFGETNPSKRKQMELEADRFSGSALRLLGTTFDEAKAGVETFALDAEQQYHPSARARSEAVASGWTLQQERLEKMGIGVNTNPSTGLPRDRDSDADGIPDKDDACPEEYGRALTAGCPDADEDGVTDRDDPCRYRKGPAQWKGCPDTDGDGLPDHEDQCPDKPGYPADKGCPPPDRDSDAVPDRADKCPDAYGLPQYQGCPDTDGGGVPDLDDKCPNEKGEALYQGCVSPQLSESSAHTDNMIFVKGGVFTMGCKIGRDKDCSDDEKPAHSVTVNDFYIGKYEVTQAEWKKVMGNSPSHFKDCGNCPVEQVSWNDVQEFLKKLNTQNSGKNYRLPTEAEWEYAARGGNLSRGFLYAGSNNLKDVGWYSDNSDKKPHPIGEKKANELGLYDISGNVMEWCSDWFDFDYYKNSPAANPAGPASGSYRVLRGGWWSDDDPRLCRVADRVSGLPGGYGYFVGFRLAASPSR
jgi:formylglycine-generating enzyme required for sulfatase activity